MITNISNRVLYTGVTNDLTRRIHEHRQRLADSFTAKYNVYKLVHFEEFDDVAFAIEREKQIKGWRRSKKDYLVEQENPIWRDLYDDLQ